MKTILLSLSIFLFANPSIGQRKYTKKSIKPKEITACIHRFSLTPEQRLKEYPFSKARQIQLVSFSQKDDTSEYILVSVPIKNDTLSMARVKGIANLTKSQIDKLTDILFNVGLKENSYTFSVSTAVGLDGGILFIDSKNKIFEYISICFDCQEIEVRTSKVRKSLGLPCIEKMGMLKAFFIESGLTF
jgi:hypothetical protein